MLIPLGALVILAAAIFAMSQAGWFDEDSGYRAPRFALGLADLSYAEPNSEPTTGMRFQASIYGTVTDAPAVRAAMVDPRVGSGSVSGIVHEDVARFVRAWPQTGLLDRGAPALTSHLALQPEDFATGGRLILREGCLRIVKQGWDEERLVVPFGPIDLFRDPEGYLAIGAYDGPEETRLRIGEPGGLVRVIPVLDSQLEGAAEFRERCGSAIVLLASAKRLPDCSGEYLAAEEERQRRSRADYERVAEEVREKAAACEARNAAGGGAPVPCPPAVVPVPPPPMPPPPPDTGGSNVCRHPDEPIPDTPEVRA
jgi:hypothetical protein